MNDISKQTIDSILVTTRLRKIRENEILYHKKMGEYLVADVIKRLGDESKIRRYEILQQNLQNEISKIGRDIDADYIELENFILKAIPR
jgi:hypothetical protein